MDEDIAIDILTKLKNGYKTPSEIQSDWAKNAVIINQQNFKDTWEWLKSHKNIIQEPNQNDKAKMIINPDNDLLPVLSKRKQEKNVVSKQDNRIEKSKKWKEEHWILTKIIESSINTIVALIIGGAVGFLGGYLIAKKSPQLPAPQSTNPKTTVQ